MIKTCVVCGSPFPITYRRGYAKTCSPNCSLNLKRKRDKKSKGRFHDKNPNYMREWNRENPEKHKEYHRKHYVKNREKYLKRRKESYQTRNKEPREKLLKIIGSSCVLCGCSRCLNFHKIGGKKHPMTFEYYFNHREDFVSLCYYHHRIIHQLAILYKWDLVKELVEKLRIKN